jgi:hypothetical protein
MGQRFHLKNQNRTGVKPELLAIGAMTALFPPISAYAPITVAS